MASISLDALRRHVECPICFCVPRDGKMFNCSNGHLICGPCLEGHLKSRPFNKTCPNGGCPYVQPPARNRAVEAIILENESAFEHNCRHAGCAFESSKGSVADHEARSCPLRLARCPNWSCGARVTVAMFVTHLEAVHNAKKVYLVDEESGGGSTSFTSTFFIEPDKLNVNGMPTTWGIGTIYHWSRLGLTFAPRLHKGKNGFSLWLGCIGDRDAADKCSADLALSAAVSAGAPDDTAGSGWNSLEYKGYSPVPVEVPDEDVAEDNGGSSSWCPLQVSWKTLRALSFSPPNPNPAPGTSRKWGLVVKYRIFESSSGSGAAS